MAPLDRVRCPSCRAVTRWQGNPHRPFCSERCQLEDLGNWAAGRYRIPGQELVPKEPAEPPDDDE